MSRPYAVARERVVKALARRQEALSRLVAVRGTPEYPAAERESWAACKAYYAAVYQATASDTRLDRTWGTLLGAP